MLSWDRSSRRFPGSTVAVAMFTYGAQYEGPLIGLSSLSLHNLVHRGTANQRRA